MLLMHKCGTGEIIIRVVPSRTRFNPNMREKYLYISVPPTMLFLPVHYELSIQEATKRLKLKIGDRIKWRTLKVDHAIVGGRDKLEDTWQLSDLPVEAGRSMPRHTLTWSPEIVRFTVGNELNMQKHNLKKWRMAYQQLVIVEYHQKQGEITTATVWPT